MVLISLNYYNKREIKVYENLKILYNKKRI